MQATAEAYGIGVNQLSAHTRKKEPLENIFDEKSKKINPLVISICNDYGYCANCDMVGDTKIKKL
jgi:hypothetical protein